MLDGRETLNSTSSGEDGVCGQKEQTGAFTTQHIYKEIAAGALPFLGGPPTCGIQVLATGLDRRYEAVRGQWRLGLASYG